MGAITPNLNLYKPGGGSSGLILPDERVDIDKINGNMDLIDAFAGTQAAFRTAQLTHNQQYRGLAADIGTVAGPVEGDTYQETDGTKRKLRFKYGGWVPYDPVIAVNATGTQAGITASTAVTGLSVSLTLVTAGAIRVAAGFTHYASVSDTVLAASLKDGATILTNWTRNANSNPANSGNGSTFEMVLPSLAAGAHTFTIEVSRAAGTGTITVAPTTVNQSFLSVEVI